MASHFNSSRPAPETACEPPRAGRRWGAAAWGWLVAVALALAWQAVTYRGLYPWAAEWQFARFDRDFPTLTLAGLAMLFGWPALLLRRRTARLDGGLRVGHGSMHALFGLAAALALAALASFGWTFALPRADGAPRLLAATARSLPDGPAVLPANVRFGRVASFGRGILLLRHRALYAPVLDAGGIRTVVELAADGTPPGRQGILVHAELPGPLVRLYGAIGYRLTARPAVLYASAATLRWPYYLAALQLALGATALLLAGWCQQQHVRRLTRRAAG